MYSQRDTLRSAPRLKGTNGLLKEALLAFCGLTACNGGTIQGIVLDWQGRPIADARVHIVDPFKAGDSLRNYTKTDEDGSFAIQMDPGKYQVLVSKEQTGYPDLQSSFFSAGDSTPEVSLKGAGNVVSVTVHLRKPFGHLSGHVKDSATGLAVANADLRFEFQQTRTPF